jgi:hypothetical protein
LFGGHGVSQFLPTANKPYDGESESGDEPDGGGDHRRLVILTRLSVRGIGTARVGVVGS